MTEPTRTGESVPLHIDLVRELREALGMFAGAMDCTPQQAWEEAIALVRSHAGTVADAAFDLAADDVLTAWRVRNAALNVAAAFVHPGPDHADMTARQALVREWVQDGHEQVEGENRQRTQMLQRMLRVEQAIDAALAEMKHGRDGLARHLLEAAQTASTERDAGS